jgi:hypothetical protein
VHLFWQYRKILLEYFEYFSNILALSLSRKDTKFRSAILPQIQVALSLNKLCGRNYIMLFFLEKIFNKPLQQICIQQSTIYIQQEYEHEELIKDEHHTLPICILDEFLIYFSMQCNNL